MDNNDGGPAFPVASSSAPYRDRGLTLRDYFAAAALTGILANDKFQPDIGRDDIPATSKIAYRVADQMLRFRYK